MTLQITNTTVYDGADIAAICQVAYNSVERIDIRYQNNFSRAPHTKWSADPSSAVAFKRVYATDTLNIKIVRPNLLPVDALTALACATRDVDLAPNKVREDLITHLIGSFGRASSSDFDSLTIRIYPKPASLKKSRLVIAERAVQDLQVSIARNHELILETEEKLQRLRRNTPALLQRLAKAEAKMSKLKQKGGGK